MANLPSPPGSRHERAQLARAVLANRRWVRILTALYLPMVIFLQALVGWRAHADWSLWLPLALVPLLTIIYARQMLAAGWDLRGLDEQVRTMGAWRVVGTVPTSGDPVTLTGHMVYTARADVGCLNQFVHVDLDASD
jgi:hypothetical protein